jgi:hypothetical protein
LDPNKNSGAIYSAWDTDTITLTSAADTIDLSSLQYSDDISTVAIGATTISNGGYSIGTGGTGSVTGGYAFTPNTVWTTNTTATGSFTISPNYSAVGSQLDQNGRMSLRGDKADLDINGKSLKDWMERVEERLNILTPNPELEKDWDDLRRLGERYRKLEKKCKEKAEVWKKLKAMPPPKL